MGVSIRIVLLLLGVVLAEAVLHVATATIAPVEARLSGLKPRYVSDPVLYVRGDSSLPDYDDRGFRNETRPAHAAVVAIGDSQTEGSGVARENAWPQQLATRLATSVYQMAFGSYGPGHYLTLIDDALALHPQTVVVAVYTGNDLAGAFDWVYGKGRDADLRSESPLHAAALERADQERGPIDRAWQRARDAEKGLYGRPELAWLRSTVESRSKIVALYEQLRWRISGRAVRFVGDEVAEDWQSTLRAIEGVPHEVLFPFDDGDVRTVFLPQARLAAQDLDDVRIAEGLRVTLMTLERIAAKCRDRSRLLVMLMPTKELVFADRVQASSVAPPSDFARLIDREASLRTQLEASLRERGIETIDPLPDMRALLATSDRDRRPINPYPETWDGHPAAAGHAAVSRTVAAAISRPPA